ncbi:hypothetical protein [Pseudoalteromonas denitrificans]|uniref:Uncharacterized protein n=1 Tax=Pseudoalteromonas denitrificans DSM 6059 TaxID=1123010 RepID=A0A1I1SQT4_9GAMM|nr:hypothetical protein [Pseudoalteromonas denitrificans]SFD48814.1 hypothetical protein SAMN02745724_04657 [Pseudoalteromonas denitrificans DSM 6059]
MSIDIANLFKNMASTAGSDLQEDGDNISGNLLKVLDNNKESIAELVEARANGDINQEDFDSELAREKSILEVEMLGLEIASKAAIQKAVNAAIGTLTSAVSAAL